MFTFVFICDSFFFNDPPTTDIYTLSLHDALPICLVLLLAVLLLLLLVAPCLNCLEAVKKPPPVAFKVMCLLPARARSEERFSRNAETDLVCRLLLEKKKKKKQRFRRCKDNTTLIR